MPIAIILFIFAACSLQSQPIRKDSLKNEISVGGGLIWMARVGVQKGIVSHFTASHRLHKTLYVIGESYVVNTNYYTGGIYRQTFANLGIMRKVEVAKRDFFAFRVTSGAVFNSITGTSVVFKNGVGINALFAITGGFYLNKKHTFGVDFDYEYGGVAIKNKWHSPTAANIRKVEYGIGIESINFVANF